MTMKPINEVYPEHAKIQAKEEYFYGPSNYQPLLESMGHEILLQVDDSDYQGDSRLILKEGSKYGLLIFGWGSCSGCDALQACDSMKDIEELRESLKQSVQWYDSASVLLNYINNKDWEVNFAWKADETKNFLAQAKALLAARTKEQSK